MRRLYQVKTKYPPQPTFFNDIFTTYLCMRGLSRTHKMTKYTPQPTFFNDIFTTYLCMCGLPRMRKMTK